MPDTEALISLAFWVAASIVALGVAFAAVTLLVRHLWGERLALLMGAASVVAVAYIFASRDVLDLGGHAAWRLLVFVSSLGTGYLALGVVVHRRMSVLTLKQAAVAGGFAAAAFAIVGVAALGLLVVVSLAFD